MPASNPSPPPDASGTVRGLVSLLAQTFAGVKTFTSTLIASAGIQLGLLFNTNGGGASDVVVKVGSSVADASVNFAAKLLSVRTGLGGTEVEKLSIRGDGGLTGTYIFLPNAGSGGVSWGNCSINGQNVTGNLELKYNGAASILTLNTFTGRIDQGGTDSTGTPGAATINKPIGKSAIAIGAASVVITNSLVAAASHVVITPHARDATCKELIVVPAAGSFTVSGSANATAALPFSWEVKGLL